MVVGRFKKWLEPVSNRSLTTALKNQCISPDLAAHIDRMPGQLGSLGHDPWGLSRDALAVGLTQFKPIYEKYFRTEAYGLENIPQTGRIMLIGNHSGQLPLDGMLIGYSIMMNPAAPRTARAMIERWVPTMPYIGNWLNSIGAVVGDPSNCRKLLRREEAVIVFPEGIRGSGKTYDKKYQLQKFGTGFMHLAVTENTPVIPVGVIGCEETFPSIANVKPLAKMLGMPYFPLMLPMPLPAKVRLYFGEPVQYSVVKGTEEELEEQVADVQSRIDALIQQGLKQRKGWFN